MSEIHIVFMRHGRSRADDEGVHEGRYDSPLTEVGRAQVRARALGWHADAVAFDRIICSPLVRAHESARIVGQVLDVAVETDPDWMERDNGPLAGMAFETARALFPRPDFRNPYEPFCGTGESDWQLYCRAARALESVVRRGPGRYLVVAHGGVLNSALRGLIGVPPGANGQGVWFAFGDAGYARAVYHPAEHVWVIEELRSG